MNDKTHQPPADFLNQFNNAIAACGKVQADVLQECSQAQLELIHLWMEYNFKQIKHLSTAEKPADIVAAESDVTMEYMNKFYKNRIQMFEALSTFQDKILNLAKDNDQLLQSDLTKTRPQAGRKSSAGKSVNSA